MAQKRVALTGLPAAVFQHPLDRQATENLKHIKGFDWLVSKFIELGIERIEYATHSSGSIRIGPRQMAKHYAMVRECCAILDVPEPPVYVAQGGVNAFTSGHTHPFIVLETGLLELLDDDDEVMAVIGHELGHIKCGHVLYTTMARGIVPLLEVIGKATLGIGQLVGSTIEAGLLAWSRRAELTADRAGMLVMQDSRPCLRVLMKIAGGTERHVDWLDHEEFLKQAREYSELADDSLSERFYRFMVTLRATHPFAIERAKALDDWVNSPAYARILSGDFSEEIYDNTAPQAPSVGISQAAGAFADNLSSSVSDLRDRVSINLNKFWKR